jgi:carbonic anhydrase
MQTRTPLAAWMLATTLAFAGADASAQEFAYSSEQGPAHWGELDPAWGACAAGEQQSPVDLGRRFERRRRFRGLALEYGPTAGEIFDNGHTIEVETEGENVLALDGTRYALVQFHFHTPSEHRVAGRGWDMELHLVHRSAEGSLAVVGVFLRRGPDSGALAPIFESLPDDVDVHHPLEEEFDPATFLPRSRVNYRYAGSLTTPPCTEGVRWIVLAEPVTISDEHMALFNERVFFNARPVQRSAP